MLSLCFCSAPEASHPPPAEFADRPLLKNFIGINAHATFDPELYKSVSHMARSYHNIIWDVQKPGDSLNLPFISDVRLPSGEKLDDWITDIYGPWTSSGFEIDISLLLQNFGPADPNYISSWDLDWAAKYGFETAKMYGSAGEVRATSIEIGNEPGARFDSELYRNIFKNMAMGIRAADSTLQIVTCSVSVGGKGDENRKDLNGLFDEEEILPLYDVINLHTYAFKPKGYLGETKARSFPEDPEIDFLKVVDETIQWRDRHAQGKEIWVTEFGWDSYETTAEGADYPLNFVSETQQANFLVRSILNLMLRDVQRAYIYFYDDAGKMSIHQSSGLTRNFVPKKSFWAVRFLYEVLGDYRINRVVSQTEELQVLELLNPTSNSMVWVAWVPVFKEQNIQMSLEEMPVMQARTVKLPMKQGEQLPEHIVKQGDEITITETPIFIFMDQSVPGRN